MSNEGENTGTKGRHGDVEHTEALGRGVNDSGRASTGGNRDDDETATVVTKTPEELYV